MTTTRRGDGGVKNRQLLAWPETFQLCPNGEEQIVVDARSDDVKNPFDSIINRLIAL